MVNFNVSINRVDEKVKFILQKRLIFRSSDAVHRNVLNFSGGNFSHSACLFSFACLLACLPVCYCLNVRKFICLSVRLSFICLRFCLYYFHSVCLSVFLSVCLSVCLSVYLNICMSVCLPVCLSVWLSACLHICMYICLTAYLS
jgi:hypothetical protein